LVVVVDALVVVVVAAVVVVAIAMVTLARQMREMGGDFLLDPLLDVVAVNVKMLVIFLNVDDLDRRRRMTQVRPRVGGMRN
jgi:uncharacterized membrane protein